MTIGVYTFELHLPAAQSLKNKRQVVRRLKDRLRSRHNVAVAETNEHADRWQRANIVVVSVANGRDALERLFESVHREAEQQVPGQVIETGHEYIEAVDGDSRGWNEDWR
jgi:uncharacterized protein YlxP (DUF503 family)